MPRRPTKTAGDSPDPGDRPADQSGRAWRVVPQWDEFRAGKGLWGLLDLPDGTWAGARRVVRVPPLDRNVWFVRCADEHPTRKAVPDVSLTAALWFAEEQTGTRLRNGRDPWPYLQAFRDWFRACELSRAKDAVNPLLTFREWLGGRDLGDLADAAPAKGTVGWYRVLPVLPRVRCEPSIDGTSLEVSVPGYEPCQQSTDPWQDFSGALTALQNAERLIGFDILPTPMSLSEASIRIPNMVETGMLDSPVRVVPFPQNGTEAWFPRFPSGEEGLGSCFSDDFLREAIQEVQEHTDLKLAPGENPWLYLHDFQGYCALVAEKVSGATLQGKKDDEPLEVPSFMNWRRAEADKRLYHRVEAEADLSAQRGPALPPPALDAKDRVLSILLQLEEELERLRATLELGDLGFGKVAVVIGPKRQRLMEVEGQNKSLLVPVPVVDHSEHMRSAKCVADLVARLSRLGYEVPVLWKTATVIWSTAARRFGDRCYYLPSDLMDIDRMFGEVRQETDRLEHPQASGEFLGEPAECALRGLQEQGPWNPVTESLVPFTKALQEWLQTRPTLEDLAYASQKPTSKVADILRECCMDDAVAWLDLNVGVPYADKLRDRIQALLRALREWEAEAWEKWTWEGLSVPCPQSLRDKYDDGPLEIADQLVRWLSVQVAMLKQKMTKTVLSSPVLQALRNVEAILEQCHETPDLELWRKYKEAVRWLKALGHEDAPRFEFLTPIGVGDGKGGTTWREWSEPIPRVLSLVRHAISEEELRLKAEAVLRENRERQGLQTQAGARTSSPDKGQPSGGARTTGEDMASSLHDRVAAKLEVLGRLKQTVKEQIRRLPSYAVELPVGGDIDDKTRERFQGLHVGALDADAQEYLDGVPAEARDFFAEAGVGDPAPEAWVQGARRIEGLLDELLQLGYHVEDDWLGAHRLGKVKLSSGYDRDNKREVLIVSRDTMELSELERKVGYAIRRLTVAPAQAPTPKRDDATDERREPAEDLAARTREQEPQSSQQGQGAENLFRWREPVWEVRYKGSEVRLVLNQAGMGALRALLSKPGQEWEVLDLLGIEDGVPDVGALRKVGDLDTPQADGNESQDLVLDRTAGGTGTEGAEVVDPNVVQAVHARIAAIAEEKRGATGPAWDKLDDEEQKLKRYLKSAENLRGTSRTFSTRADKDADTLSQRLRRCMTTIGDAKNLPALGDHLRQSIRLGSHPLYHPREATTWAVE